MALSAGFILFDDPDSPSVGWICVHGESPYRISSLSSLGNQTVFWTNATWKSAFQNKILAHAYLRTEGFFRLGLDNIMQEVGIHDATPQVKVKWLSSVFHFASSLSSESFGFKNIPLGDLKQSIRASILPSDPHCHKDIINISRDALQEYASCEYVANPGSRVVSIFLPRLAHAKKILSLNYPASHEMDSVPRTRLPKKNATKEGIFDWIFDIKRPSLVKIKVNGTIEPRLASLFGHGTMVRSGKKKRRDGTVEIFSPLREWVTIQDLVNILRIFDVTIVDALVFKKTRVLLKEVQVVHDFFHRYDDPIYQASYALGLVADSLWTASAATQYVIPTNQDSINVASPFIRSVDRSLLFEHAVSLAELGFIVMGYGVGRINISINDNDDQEKKDLVNFCVQRGIIPPPFASGELQSAPLDGVNEVVSALQTAVYYGDYDSLSMLDSFLEGGV